MTRDITGDLLAFLDASPTPFHATANLKAALLASGFTELHESEPWELRTGQRYVVTRNDSSLIAFCTSAQDPAHSGIRLVGAHTDSPCLKLKPEPDLQRQGYAQLGVEVYGGALLHPWFDRDLSLAGRICYQRHDGTLARALIHFPHAIACIPSLAIHLDREVNNGRALNAQKELPLLLHSISTDEKIHIRSLLLTQLLAQYPDCNATAVLDFEISVCDTQAAAKIGLHHAFIASARLDNLLSCYAGLRAMLDCDQQQPTMLVCTDHEEVGSVSSCGAQGNFLTSVMQRWLGSSENVARTTHRSMMISADNAHGIHPNYPEKHDENHGPQLNRGPVIKINANQRYASNAITQAFFRQLCEQHRIPLQTFVARADMGCGSTIGPLTAAETGMRTLDIGVPTFAMHSIRELAGVEDVNYLERALHAFFNSPQLPD
ncbi:MAG: M18 family aminopeptidase [Pseudomonadales bacterium]|nr:M18 family aminopeptidase [Pseudomonadales bacterium]